MGRATCTTAPSRSRLGGLRPRACAPRRDLTGTLPSVAGEVAWTKVHPTDWQRHSTRSGASKKCVPERSLGARFYDVNNAVDK